MPGSDLSEFIFAWLPAALRGMRQGDGCTPRRWRRLDESEMLSGDAFNEFCKVCAEATKWCWKANLAHQASRKRRLAFKRGSSGSSLEKGGRPLGKRQASTRNPQGRIKAVIWGKEIEGGGLRHNVRIRRLYKDGDDGKDSNSFGR